MIRASSDSTRQSGVILIALLWILTALSVIALSFSRESFVEVAAARNDRDMSDAYYLARAGIMATTYQLIQKRYVPRVQQLQLDAPPDPIDVGKVSGTFGDGTYDVEIQDESGKININFVSEEQLHGLFEAVGIDKRDGDTLADSIMDWRDVDTAVRINGAEDDYYQSLRPPYKAKNGRVDTVEELLLVKGMTREYFYGFSEKTPDGSVGYKYGLWRYFTVYSNRNQININNAEIPVLLSIPGMTPPAAQAIYDRRKAKPFANMGEVTKDLTVSLGPATMPFLTTEPSGIYTLRASAHREGSKVRRLIRAVVSLDPNQQERYRIVYWNENVPDL